jgi:hypothetical protein
MILIVFSFHSLMGNKMTSHIEIVRCVSTGRL